MEKTWQSSDWKLCNGKPMSWKKLSSLSNIGNTQCKQNPILWLKLTSQTQTWIFVSFLQRHTFNFVGLLKKQCLQFTNIKLILVQHQIRPLKLPTFNAAIWCCCKYTEIKCFPLQYPGLQDPWREGFYNFWQISLLFIPCK